MFVYISSQKNPRDLKYPRIGPTHMKKSFEDGERNRDSSLYLVSAGLFGGSSAKRGV